MFNVVCEVKTLRLHVRGAYSEKFALSHAFILQRGPSILDTKAVIAFLSTLSY